MANEREHLGSRLGFILLSAGCAIGCGNVWKFPWMAGQYGGGAFVLVYLICLAVLGLPIMIMEFALGRASQKSPVKMYQALEKKGQKWHIHGFAALAGNVALMAFYLVVTGWMVYYFKMFLTGNTADLSFVGMITNAKVNVFYLYVVIIAAFAILSFNIQKGLEKVTKYMMVALLLLIVVLAANSATLSGAKEGLKFYLVPSFKKINFNVIVGAMNQAFFTLSLGIGSMAIFGSYIGKEKSLVTESINIIALDTFVALMAGFIMFPACATYGVSVNAGPALLFDTMATVFRNMAGGRFWGTLFFLFMVFAAFSTVLAVCENIIACVKDLTGWNRISTSITCGGIMFMFALTTALGYSVFSFQPFASGSAWLDFWDFIVSTNLLPLGSLCICCFCVSKKYGWGWDNFIAEANSGDGLKVPKIMKPICTFIVPLIVLGLYTYGLITFGWK